MIGHDDSVNVVFTTYSELSAFSFSIPSGTHFVYTEHTSRSATENVQHGWFNAGQLTSFICHIDSYHSRTVSTDVNEERLPFAMGILKGQRYCPHQVQQPMDIDVPQLLRRNFKRSCEYEPCNVELKRFRPETGSGRIRYERESMKTCEMDQIQDSSSSISIGHNYQSYFLPVNNILINNPGCKNTLSSNKSSTNKSDTEYERMLFETHGSTAYHYQRTQLSGNGNIETEF